eukprot:1921383-Amphidinium_carterae.1
MSMQLYAGHRKYVDNRGLNDHRVLRIRLENSCWPVSTPTVAASHVSPATWHISGHEIQSEP